MPGADEPALHLSYAERQAAVDRAIARISTMFWGGVSLSMRLARRSASGFAETSHERARRRVRRTRIASGVRDALTRTRNGPADALSVARALQHDDPRESA